MLVKKENFYQIIEDDLTINLGVSAYYMNDTEVGKNKFFIYPKVTASYRMVDEILIAYGGIKGDLNQNSYYDFAKQNPFIMVLWVLTLCINLIMPIFNLASGVEFYLQVFLILIAFTQIKYKISNK